MQNTFALTVDEAGKKTKNKKMSEVATSAKHSSLSAEAAASMQAVSR